MTDSIEVGDRVDTKEFGMGTVELWERVNDAWTGFPQRLVSTGRVGVKLDEAEKHTLYKNGIAYFYPKELIKEQHGNQDTV